MWLLYSLKDFIGYISCEEQKKTQQHERIKKGIVSVSDLKRFRLGFAVNFPFEPCVQFGSWFFQAVLRMVGIALSHLFGRPSRCSCSESLCCQNTAGTSPQKAALLSHRWTARIDRKMPQSGVSAKVYVLKDHLPLLGRDKNLHSHAVTLTCHCKDW